MENINGTLLGFLFASASLNIFLLWFLVKSLRKLLFVSYNLEDINEAINNYREHLKSVYELETFYGDQTLQSLLTHSYGLAEFLEQFEDIYEISYDEQSEEDNDERREQAYGEYSPSEEEEEEKKG